ncbi:intermembrane phospholipid transport protein YdbH family protein [Sphingomonas sp.]|uniref:intermembrane phospholipid transport protein YdbH family protein n=1 Tax=Sphingomonas sp. TaxID=28214 RepID=UPI003CC69AE8
MSSAAVLEEEETPRPRRRWPRRVGAAVAVLLVLLGGLWLFRKPLASHYADSFLAGKHVAVRYDIADLGPGRQRLVNVVLGDPAAPDLVADWLETRTALGRSGPYLAGVRGGHVRVRARWLNGRLSLGSLDRLLPQGQGGGPFTLPALSLDVEDLRARIETPWGVVGARLSGQGPLDGGFDGRLAVTAARLDAGCAATAPAAALRVRTLGAGLLRRMPAVRLEGSAQAEALACAGVTSGYANLNGAGEITLGGTTAWRAQADLAANALRHPIAAARAATARVQLTGGAGGTRGTLDLRASDWTTTVAAGRRLAIAGPVVIDAAGLRLGEGGDAALTANGVRLGSAQLRRADALAIAAPGTPVAPLLVAWAQAARRAGQNFDAAARASVAVTGDEGMARIASAAVQTRSGATLRWTGSARSGWGSSPSVDLDGALAASGGGLPAVSAQLARHDAGPLHGVAKIAPYAAADAKLALSPVSFGGASGGWRVATVATLSGPFGDGRVDMLTLPLDAQWHGGALSVGRACTPIRWVRVAVAGLVLDPGGVRLCPAGDALLTVKDGRLGGGASLRATQLSGRLGGTPLTLAAAGATLQLSDRRFALQGIAARLGRTGRITRLDLATLEGGAGPGGLAGRFTGGGGQIGAVPLLVSNAAGSWRFTRGGLSLDGALTVGDADTAHPRFRPMPVDGVALTLRNGEVDATGALRAPGGPRLVADLRLHHDLDAGTGSARLAVPGLVFDQALQPDQLTPLTFGVIADVRGTVTGEGAIDWSPAGVRSTGRFTTTGTDLAAAFGPVQGIAGTIRFTDLLALESAPGQTFGLRAINPGVLVPDGVVRFQTLPGTRVRVEGARWPFAGGELTLLPTMLDFGQDVERRMTFRVAGAQADRFLQQFDFGNLNATGVFDGELPMVFDASGGRIENGRLTVRPGGGTLAYVGPVSQKNLGFWGNFAFQALRSVRYRALGIAMNGPLAGEMITDVRFAGVTQGTGAQSNFLIRRLQRLPIVFNIRIRAPFRGLLDATASFYDPTNLINQHLSDLREHGLPAPAPIQPPASTPVPQGVQRR